MIYSILFLGVKVSDNNEPVESDSDKQSDTEAYAYEHITSKEDSKIKDEIDRAQTTIRDVSWKSYRK